MILTLPRAAFLISRNLNTWQWKLLGLQYDVQGSKNEWQTVPSAERGDGDQRESDRRSLCLNSLLRSGRESSPGEQRWRGDIEKRTK